MIRRTHAIIIPCIPWSQMYFNVHLHSDKINTNIIKRHLIANNTLAVGNHFCDSIHEPMPFLTITSGYDLGPLLLTWINFNLNIDR